MLTSFYLRRKSSEICIKTRTTPASLLFRGLVTEHRTVKWSIFSIRYHTFSLFLQQLTFKRPSNDRNLSFEMIAKEANLPIDEVRKS